MLHEFAVSVIFVGLGLVASEVLSELFLPYMFALLVKRIFSSPLIFETPQAGFGPNYVCLVDRGHITISYEGLCGKMENVCRRISVTLRQVSFCPISPLSPDKQKRYSPARILWHKSQQTLWSRDRELHNHQVSFNISSQRLPSSRLVI